VIPEGAATKSQIIVKQSHILPKRYNNEKSQLQRSIVNRETVIIHFLFPTLIPLSGVDMFSSCCDKHSAINFSIGRLPYVNPPETGVGTNECKSSRDQRFVPSKARNPHNTVINLQTIPFLPDNNIARELFPPIISLGCLIYLSQQDCTLVL
jgi:hypothetical protein